MENQTTIDELRGCATTTPADTQTLTDAQTLEESCMEFARTLGLERPVSPHVLEAALRDETYARHLLTSRRSPTMLEYLLTHPPKPRASAAEPPEFSQVDLAKRAAAALLRWGMVGFTVVDKETLERRRAACMSCPNLTAAPGKLIYKLTLADESDMICGLCGCSVRKKMKLSSESCPAPHPEVHGMSRWGEPRQSEAGDAASG
jgi:hypothetical protein